EVRLGEVCAREVRAAQDGAVKRCAFEIGAREVGAGQVAPLEVRASEVGTGEVCAAQYGSGKRRAPEVGAGQVGVGQVAPIKLRPAKIAARTMDSLPGEERLAVLRRGARGGHANRKRRQAAVQDEAKPVHNLLRTDRRCRSSAQFT